MTEIALNSTTMALSGAGISTMSWFGTLVIVGFMGIILSLFAVLLSSLENYARIRKWLYKAYKSINYFVWGLGTLMVLFVPISIFWFFLNQAKKGNVAPLKYSAYIIGGYVIISFIGYIGKKVYLRLNNFERRFKKHG